MNSWNEPDTGPGNSGPPSARSSRTRCVAAPTVAPVFTGGLGPMPGLDLASDRALHDAVDEGVDLDRLR